MEDAQGDERLIVQTTLAPLPPAAIAFAWSGIVQHTKLTDLIAADIAATPFHLPGDPDPWSARPVEWWTAALGISDRTLRNWISKAENIVRDRALVDGKVTMILRLGDPKAMTNRHMARILERVWKEKITVPTGKADFGRFNQLAKDWPDGYQPAILTHVLADWQQFMTAVDAVMSEANSDALVNGEPPPWTKKFFKYPSLRVIVWASVAGIESYETHLQEQGFAGWAAFHKARKAKAAA